MPSQYTTSLKLQEIASGEQSGIWGATTNNNLNLIEQAITGVTTINMGDQNYTLSNLNGVPSDARNAVIVATGTNTATRQIIAPLVEKVYIVSNKTVGGNPITVGGSTGSLVTVFPDETSQLYCNGQDFVGISGFATSITNPGGWNVTPTGTKLFFNYNGTNVGSLDSSGNFVVIGNVTAYGAP